MGVCGSVRLPCPDLMHLHQCMEVMEPWWRPNDHGLARRGTIICPA